VKALTNGKAADLAFDAVGGPMFEPCLKSLRLGGRQVAITSNARRYSGMTLANLITVVHVRRQLKLEDRTFVDSPRHPDTAVMAFDNRMADGKAKSHTTLFGREHRVENMIVVGWVDTRASILDDHVNKIWFANAGSYAQYSRRSRLHRLNGVHD
jgi:NADPH:quinone reductase-like Zn-dependent oxidoreductase